MSTFKGSLWGTTGESSNLETNPTTITTNTTIASVNQTYLVDSSNNNIDITLPISASSGDQIIIHHEAFSSNEVNIIDPAFGTQRFFPNGITRVRCTYMSGTQITSHWDIHGDILGLDGQILPAFKERIVETAVASQFYLSNQTLLSGKSLYTNQSILQGGNSQFTGNSGVIEKFFTPSLNITNLKKGVYSISIFANLPNAPTSGTFRLLVDILKIDENGTIGSVVPIAQNIDALNAKTLNNDIERFDFSYITNADIPINATDRLRLDIKFQGSVSETVKIYYGEGGFTSNIITSIEKKDTLASANLFIGNANNEAQARPITGDITISNTGVATVIPKAPIGQVSFHYNTADFLPEGYVKCSLVPMSTTSPLYSNLYNLAVSTGSTTTNSSEKGKFLVIGTTFYSPDHRGYFIRPLGGVDPDARTLGSIQNDDFKSHNHTAIDEHRTGTVQADNPDFLSGEVTANSGFVLENRQTTSSGGTETRPKNIGLHSYIKY